MVNKDVLHIENEDYSSAIKPQSEYEYSVEEEENGYLVPVGGKTKRREGAE